MLLFCTVLSLFCLPFIRFNFGQVSVCPKGFYGDDCALKCDYCGNQSCHSNGTCITDCTDGNCDEVCPDGFYGTNCSLKCGACKDKKCAFNGYCRNGCELGWRGDQCLEVCPDGSYGANCSLKCGACKDSKCASNGSCIHGCEQDWIGDKCLEESVKIIPSVVVENTETPPLLIIIIVVGASVGLLGIVILAMTITTRKREKSIDLRSVTSEWKEAEDIEDVKVEPMKKGEAEQISVELIPEAGEEDKSQDKTGKDDSGRKEDGSGRKEDDSSRNEEDRSRNEEDRSRNEEDRSRKEDESMEKDDD